jgi:hypothetical protein
MAYVTITLTAGSSENSGPFDIIGTPGNVTLFSEVAYNDLATGQVYDIDMNTYTGITLTSSGQCNNSVGPYTFDGGGQGCTCPEGYSVTNDGLGCYKVTTTSATSVDTKQPGTGAGNGAYGDFGVVMYNVNDYNLNGSSISGTYAYDGRYFGTNANMTVSELFWSNRMNYNGVWVSGNSTYVGTLSFCTTINVTTTKVYYIGVAGDNEITVKVNGTTIVDQPAGGTPVGGTTSPTNNFKYWHVYPYTLNAGPNIVELSNYNAGSVGDYAAEIYDNTLSELTGATSASSINIIFSTGDYLPARAISGRTTTVADNLVEFIENVGNGSKYGEGFCTNYSCQSGYVLDTSDPEAPTCKLIEYSVCIS